MRSGVPHSIRVIAWINLHVSFTKLHVSIDACFDVPYPAKIRPAGHAIWIARLQARNGRE